MPAPERPDAPPPSPASEARASAAEAPPAPHNPLSPPEGALARGTLPHAQYHAAELADEPPRRDSAQELRELEATLGRVVQGLMLHVQPIVDARTRQRFGYEALLRSTERGLPHPGAVLDAAERLERVPAIGRAIRASAARLLAEAPAARGPMFINLHLLDLFDRQLTSPFAPLTKVAGRVVLEITERTSLEGQSDLRFRLAELRELGFKIAIDDLGAGHARMGALSLVDCDYVKLDMSLVRDIERHATKQRLVQRVLELCRPRGITVIGEGVETEAEAATLTALGCDLLQGYLIARPAAPFCDPL